MTAEDQTGDGTTVKVASIDLPDGGFVAIHSNANGSPGPVIGHSDLLPKGTSEDVVVNLDTPLTADDTVFPMAHLDANNDGQYEFPGADVPATDAQGNVVVLPVKYTVQAGSATPEPTASPEPSTTPEPSSSPAAGAASMTVGDQSGDGTTVMIPSVTLPNGGFVAIHSDANGAPGPVIGHSDLLPPGESTNVSVKLDTALTVNAVVWPMAHVDGNNDGQYEFPGPDAPATDAQGNVVVIKVNYAFSAGGGYTAY